MKEILVLFPCREAVKKKLQAAAPDFHFTFLPQKTQGDQIERMDKIASAQVILGEPSVEELKVAKKLEWLQISWSGTDKYTKFPLLPQNVIMTNTTGVFGKSIAEWLLGTLLSLYKKLPSYRDRQRENAWKDMGKEKTLYGKRVLIFGAGDIGMSFARLLVPFHTETIGIRRKKAECPPEFLKIYTEETLTQEGLFEELKKADVIAMCLPDTKETEGFMDLKKLRLLKEDAVLLNVGRGKTLVTKDLLTVLNEGKLYGVGLDVVDTEPLPPESPLWEIERVLITPHIAGQGLNHLEETYEQIAEIFIENIRRYANGEPLLNLVDKAAGYRA